jgi:hypothetical protein
MGENNNTAYENESLELVKLAQGYFPSQQLNEVCISVKCLDTGTIFPDLDMPYSSNNKYEYDNNMS